MENKTHWKRVFNSDYLGACDLDGKDLVATIKSVSVQKVKNTDGKEQERNVATFTDPSIKPMILNVTNCKIIKKFAKTPFIQDWSNIPVAIYVKDDIRAFGETTEGLRIRESQPNISKPVLAPNSQNWNKAVDALKNGKTLANILKYYEVSETDQRQLISEAKPNQEQLLNEAV
jgi:hypothetical protein